MSSILKKKFHKQHEFERSIKNQSCSFDQNYKNLIEPVCSSTPSARISSLFRPHPLILKNPCPYTQLARLVTKYTLESDERRSTWQFENHKVRPRKGCTFALGWCTYKRHLCEHTARHSCAQTFTRCAFAFLVHSPAATNPAWFLRCRSFRWLKIDSRMCTSEMVQSIQYFGQESVPSRWFFFLYFFSHFNLQFFPSRSSFSFPPFLSDFFSMEFCGAYYHRSFQHLCNFVAAILHQWHACHRRSRTNPWNQEDFSKQEKEKGCNE